MTSFLEKLDDERIGLGRKYLRSVYKTVKVKIHIIIKIAEIKKIVNEGKIKVYCYDNSEHSFRN